MPSPFPGMDPHLERAERWEPVHWWLVGFAASHLQPQLAPRYLARPQERLGLVLTGGQVIADVAVIHDRDAAGRGAVALAERTGSDRAVVVEAEYDEITDGYVDIILAATGQVVTTIEFLSPSNKDSRGRQRYIRRQARIMASGTHLVEIDLLRSGASTTAVPAGMLARHGHYDYHACVSRGGVRDRFECYPVTVRQRLPRVAIPLLGDDPDAVLDLQALLDEVYDRGFYQNEIDYRRTPEPPLTPEDEAWADAVLREKGLRTS